VKVTEIRTNEDETNFVLKIKADPNEVLDHSGTLKSMKTLGIVGENRITFVSGILCILTETISNSSVADIRKLKEKIEAIKTTRI